MSEHLHRTNVLRGERGPSGPACQREERVS